VTTINSNENIVVYDVKGSFAEGDLMRFSWAGTVPADCNPKNFLGISYTYSYNHWPAVWFGMNSGINGVKNYTMDEIHMCY
jgi:hypothetical protein